jgi:hypothetical protein
MRAARSDTPHLTRHTGVQVRRDSVMSGKIYRYLADDHARLDGRGFSVLA